VDGYGAEYAATLPTFTTVGVLTVTTLRSSSGDPPVTRCENDTVRGVPPLPESLYTRSTSVSPGCRSIAEPKLGAVMGKFWRAAVVELKPFDSLGAPIGAVPFLNRRTYTERAVVVVLPERASRRSTLIVLPGAICSGACRLESTNSW